MGHTVLTAEEKGLVKRKACTVSLPMQVYNHYAVLAALRGEDYTDGISGILREELTNRSAAELSHTMPWRLREQLALDGRLSVLDEFESQRLHGRQVFWSRWTQLLFVATVVLGALVNGLPVVIMSLICAGFLGQSLHLMDLREARWTAK